MLINVMMVIVMMMVIMMMMKIMMMQIEMMKFRERNPYSLTLYMYVELFNSLDNIEKWRGQTVDTYRVVRPLVPEVL